MTAADVRVLLAEVRSQVDHLVWSDPRQVRWIVTQLLEVVERLAEAQGSAPEPQPSAVLDEPDEPLALREQALRLREQGWSHEKIAHELGTSRRTIGRLLIGDG